MSFDKSVGFLLIISIFAAAFLLAGCQPITPAGNESINITINETQPQENQTTPSSNETANQTTPTKIDESKAAIKVEGTEGDLIKIQLNAYDPDGALITYSFQKPFNDKGLWQTEIGDEGKYLIKVTASDGLLSTSEYALVTVNRAIRPPVIECPDTVKVQETENVVLDCNIFDPQGYAVIVGYDGWMRSATYKTTYGDRGTHTVIVRAKNFKAESTKEVNVIVSKKNRPPVLEDLQDASVYETKTIKIMPKSSDPDSLPVTYTFSDPLDKEGVWTPNYGDAGVYNVTVTASNGAESASKSFMLTVLKTYRPPVLKPIEPISVMEGDLVKIPVNTYDPNGENITTTFSGWMKSSEYQTTFDDAYPNGCSTRKCTANYTVTVTVNNGHLSTSQDVLISVTDKPRPPVFTP